MLSGRPALPQPRLLHPSAEGRVKYIVYLLYYNI